MAQLEKVGEARLVYESASARLQSSLSLLPDRPQTEQGSAPFDSFAALHLPQKTYALSNKTRKASVKCEFNEGGVHSPYPCLYECIAFYFLITQVFGSETMTLVPESNRPIYY